MDLALLQAYKPAKPDLLSLSLNLRNLQTLSQEFTKIV